MEGTFKLQYIECNTSTISKLFDIKNFCGNAVEITVENCPIDTFIRVSLYGESVPEGSYIVKITESVFVNCSREELNSIKL